VTGAVVDASVALKWVLDEDGSDAAAALLDGRPLYAPALLFTEAANALWVIARRGVIAPHDAMDALETLRRAPFRSLPSGFDPVPTALRLAVLIDHPVYDCVYLAVAIEVGLPVITADRRFVAAAARQPDTAALVRPLA
jgi:predicted nucleic acid-binding protein